jgi:hypothetical protein
MVEEMRFSGIGRAAPTGQFSAGPAPLLGAEELAMLDSLRQAPHAGASTTVTPSGGGGGIGAGDGGGTPAANQLPCPTAQRMESGEADADEACESQVMRMLAPFEGAATNAQNGRPASEADETSDGDDGTLAIAPEEKLGVNQICKMCMEPVATVFSDLHDEFRFVKAVRVDGSLLHAACYSHSPDRATKAAALPLVKVLNGIPMAHFVRCERSDPDAFVKRADVHMADPPFYKRAGAHSRDCGRPVDQVIPPNVVSCTLTLGIARVSADP